MACGVGIREAPTALLCAWEGRCFCSLIKQQYFLEMSLLHLHEGIIIGIYFIYEVDVNYSGNYSVSPLNNILAVSMNQVVLYPIKK